MKAAHFLVLLCAGLLLVSPAYAHGDEAHGGAENATLSSETAGQTSKGDVAPSAVQATEETPVSREHDDAAGGHESASEAGALAFLQKLHPATVHFPIALFLVAALTELIVMAQRGASLEPAVRVLVYGGAAGGVIAALFGWIHTGLWFGGDAVMQVHRWNGMLIAALGVLLVWLARSPRESRTLLRIGLYSVSALILAQGFLGGSWHMGPITLASPGSEGKIVMSSFTREQISAAILIGAASMVLAACDQQATPNNRVEGSELGEAAPPETVFPATEADPDSSAEIESQDIPAAAAAKPERKSADQAPTRPASNPAPSSTTAPMPPKSEAAEPADPHAGHDMEAMSDHDMNRM